MKKLFHRIISLTCIFSLFSLLFFNAKASASTGYVNYDRVFDYSTTKAGYARTFFNATGYTTPVPEDFTKANVLNSVGYVTCFYVNCHGDISTYNSRICTGYDGSESIYDNEMKAIGYYKFVFCDCCLVGTNEYMANAFHIVTGDGLNHAFLGWTKSINDDYNYTLFTQTLFSFLPNKNLNDSLWQAHLNSGCTGYKIYGRWNMTMTP